MSEGNGSAAGTVPRPSTAWLPIESAPKDREIIGCYFKDWGDSAPIVYGPWTVQWWDGKWRSSWDGLQVVDYMGDFGTAYKALDMEPNYWMALPSALEAGQESLAEGLPGASAASVGTHASDCAVHNMPAYPNGPCDCGASPTPPEGLVERDAALEEAAERAELYRDGLVREFSWVAGDIAAAIRLLKGSSKP